MCSVLAPLSPSRRLFFPVMMIASLQSFTSMLAFAIVSAVVPLLLMTTYTVLPCMVSSRCCSFVSWCASVVSAKYTFVFAVSLWSSPCIASCTAHVPRLLPPIPMITSASHPRYFCAVSSMGVVSWYGSSTLARVSL